MLTKNIGQHMLDQMQLILIYTFNIIHANHSRQLGNFFQGAFAEHHVCSLIYFYGYEVQKISPDVGIDWVITNLARARFNNEDRLNVEVQVKSALFDKNEGAFVGISVDEINFLCEGEHRYSVFVLLSNLRGRSDPESFERGTDPDASRAVER